LKNEMLTLPSLDMSPGKVKETAIPWRSFRQDYYLLDLKIHCLYINQIAKSVPLLFKEVL